MKEIAGYVGNPSFGVYVPLGGREIYRLNAKRRLQKITQFPNSVSGYMMIEHRGRLWPVHQIIFRTLRPDEYREGHANGLEIDHRDADKTNNAIENLRMITHRENSANKIKRGGRCITAHNSDTFETMIFNSITDAARYIHCMPRTIIVHLNTRVPCKGWTLTTNDPTHRYTYIVDGVPVTGIDDVTAAVGVTRCYLYTLFGSPVYGNKIDINGHTIERIAFKQQNLWCVQRQNYATAPRRGRPRITAEGVRV